LLCLKWDNSGDPLTDFGRGKCGCSKDKPKWKDDKCVNPDESNIGDGTDSGNGTDTDSGNGTNPIPNTGKTTTTTTPKENGSDRIDKGSFSFKLMLTAMFFCAAHEVIYFQYYLVN